MKEIYEAAYVDSIQTLVEESKNYLASAKLYIFNSQVHTDYALRLSSQITIIVTSDG